MKNLKVLFTLFILSVFVISCSSEDENFIKVKYQINGLDSSVTQIKYRDVNGSFVTLTDIDDFGGGSDSKTISFLSDNLPFTANLEVTVNNTSPSNKIYNLIIYVNNSPVDSYDLDAPAAAITSGQVDYIVE